MPSPTPGKDLKTLALGILAILLAFVPFLCIGGAFLGIICLRKSSFPENTLLKILGLTAIIGGSLMSIQTILAVAALFQGHPPVTP